MKLYRNRLGNFVLLRASENSHLRSSSFEVKRETYLKSPYTLTRQVGETEEWTVQSIEARQAELAEIALTAWSL